MKRLPKGLQTWDIPLYGGTVLMTNDAKRFWEAEKYFGIEDEDRACAGKAVWVDGGKHFIVGVFDKSIPTLVHECSHVSLFICQRVGIDPQSGNGEPFCYLLDTMVGRFLPHIKKC